MRITFSALAMLAVLAAAGCGDGNSTPTSPSVGLNVPFSATDITVGTGAEAVTGRTVTMQYSGWLYDPGASQNKGQAFDAGTFTYVLGTTVITGWNQGIPGMRVGGSRRLVIPPSLGYGSAGSPPRIPGNATLLFEVTLVAVQ